LTPCAFDLITIGQTSAKTVGMAFRPLKAPDHVRDVDILGPWHVIGCNGQTAFIRSAFGGAVGLGSVHHFIIRCHQESIPRYARPKVKSMCKETRGTHLSGLGINPVAFRRKSHVRTVGKLPVRDYVTHFPHFFLYGRDGLRRSVRWQKETQFETGIPLKSLRLCKHYSLCGSAACLECSGASDNL
jgi:hypothetical protein